MVKLLVTAEFQAYVATFLNVKKGDATYNPAFDVNGDGVIDVLDMVYFSDNFGKWVDFKPATLQDWFAERPKLLGGIGTSKLA